MKNSNPFQATKVSLLELAKSITAKNEENRLLKEAEIQIKKKVKSKKSNNNKVKVVKSKQELYYFIPGNMKINGLKRKVEQNKEIIEDFKINNVKSILL